MKLIFFLLVLLKNGMKPTEGQLIAEFSSSAMILRFTFHPYFNYPYYVTSCCKFVELECLFLVNSRGLVAPSYQGRLLRVNFNRAFEVKIINPTISDAGIYHCGVNGFPTTNGQIKVTVSDLQNIVIGRNPAPLPTKSNIRPLVLTSTVPSMLFDEEHTEEHSSKSWNMVLTLAAVCTVVAFAVIILSVLLAFRLMKKSRDKSGTCGFHSNTLEQNGVTYSAVFFKSHQNPSELYANLGPRQSGPSSTCIFKTVENVEYATVSRAQ